MFSGGPLNRIIAGELRKALKERVDELLEATNRNSEAVEKLTEAIKELEEALQSGKVTDTSNIKGLTAEWRATGEQMFSASKLVVDVLKDVVQEINKLQG